MSRIFQMEGVKFVGVRLRQLSDEVDRSHHSDQPGGWSPAVDIYETPGEVVIVAEVAGMSRDQLRILIDGNVVRIYGHRQPVYQATGARFHRLEIASGSFVSSFRITVPFLAQKAQAKVSDGLLYLYLPKEPLPGTKQIKVKTS